MSDTRRSTPAFSSEASLDSRLTFAEFHEVLGAALITAKRYRENERDEHSHARAMTTSAADMNATDPGLVAARAQLLQCGVDAIGRAQMWARMAERLENLYPRLVQLENVMVRK